MERAGGRLIGDASFGALQAAVLVAHFTPTLYGPFRKTFKGGALAEHMAHAQVPRPSQPRKLKESRAQARAWWTNPNGTTPASASAKATLTAHDPYTTLAFPSLVVNTLGAAPSEPDEQWSRRVMHVLTGAYAGGVLHARRLENMRFAPYGAALDDDDMGGGATLSLPGVVAVLDGDRANDNSLRSRIDSACVSWLAYADLHAWNVDGPSGGAEWEQRHAVEAVATLAVACGWAAAFRGHPWAHGCQEFYHATRAQQAGAVQARAWTTFVAPFETSVALWPGNPTAAANARAFFLATAGAVGAALVDAFIIGNSMLDSAQRVANPDAGVMRVACRHAATLLAVSEWHALRSDALIVTFDPTVGASKGGSDRAHSSDGSGASRLMRHVALPALTQDNRTLLANAKAMFQAVARLGTESPAALCSVASEAADELDRKAFLLDYAAPETPDIAVEERAIVDACRRITSASLEIDEDGLEIWPEVVPHQSTALALLAELRTSAPTHSHDMRSVVADQGREVHKRTGRRDAVLRERIPALHAASSGTLRSVSSTFDPASWVEPLRVAWELHFIRLHNAIRVASSYGPHAADDPPLKRAKVALERRVRDMTGVDPNGNVGRVRQWGRIGSACSVAIAQARQYCYGEPPIGLAAPLLPSIHELAYVASPWTLTSAAGLSVNGPRVVA